MRGQVAPLLGLCFILLAPASAFAPAARTKQKRRCSASDAQPSPGTAAHHDELLWGMVRFFGGDMVDTDAKRFYYFCRPQRGECEHVHFPIRDMAAAWDATKALDFARHIGREGVADAASVVRIQQRLAGAVQCTLSFYVSALTPDAAGVGMHLREDILMEPPTIGHSALLLLGLCHAHRLSILDGDVEAKMQGVVEGLVEGMLSMQIENGAFGIEFNNRDDFLRGIEFFPGEAMLSLMSACELSPKILKESTQQSILSAMERAFHFYSDHYNTGDVDINYNIWQVLAFSKYYDALGDGTHRDDVRNYVLEMCKDVCNSRSWRHQLARGQSFYVNLETIEIACGLDALAEGMRLSRELDNSPSDLTLMFERNAKNALYFLEWCQGRVPESCAVGRGGLGYGGVQVLEQRLDVTGHAISALAKLRNLSILLP